MQNFITTTARLERKKRKNMKIDELVDVLKEIAKENGVPNHKIDKFVERFYEDFKKALDDVKKGRTIPIEKLKQ